MSKKILLPFFLIVLVLTGCSNPLSKEEKLTCTLTEKSEEGFKTNTTLVINHKDDEITKISNTIDQEMDAETLTFIKGFMDLFIQSFNSIAGITATSNVVSDTKYTMNITIDMKKLDYEALKKLNEDESTDVLDQIDKNTTFKEFKKELEKEYTCK